MATGAVYAYESIEFAAVDPILDPARGIAHPGLAQWFDRMYVRFGCRTYFTHQSDDVETRWRHEVRRSPLIAQQPELIAVQWDDDTQAEWLLWGHTTKGTLFYWTGHPIHQAITAHKMGQGENEASGCIRALVAALNGFERHRWLPPNDRGERVAEWPRNPFMRRLAKPL